MNERNPKSRAVFWTITAAVATLVLLVGTFIANNQFGSATGNGGGSAGCWKVVISSGGAGDRVIAAGVKGTPQQVHAQLLKAAQHDPVALVAIFNASPPAVKANGGSLSKDGLTENGCYTDTAKAAWFVLATEFSKAIMTTGTAPATGCNTFVVKGKLVYKCGAITGNRTGTKIVWSDGSVTWILWRCANPVTPKPPVPPKPPNPTPTPTPTPTPSCPPNQPHGHPPYCKDDPSNDPMNNPSVPAQVKGPGTGVTGPPTTPTDGPCGMTVCPTATPKPTPPSGGGPTTLPSPTEPPVTPTPIATQPPASSPIATPPPPPA